MRATAMHFAFLTSRSVNTNTPLGWRILEIAAKHHAQMEREVIEREQTRRAKPTIVVDRAV